MKAKKLEFREEIKAPENYKSFYLYINGKIVEHKYFSYDSNMKLIKGENNLEKKDCDKILSFSFLDLPDNSMIGSFPENYIGTKISKFEWITRKGKKLISNYYISVKCDKTGIIWNAEIYLEELTTNLAKKGFNWKNGGWQIDSWEESFNSFINYNHKNTTGTLLENVNECIEIIKQAEKETHARMLKLAIAEGKKK